MDNRFSDNFKAMMARARSEAQRHNSAHIEPEHLLLAIVAESRGEALAAMERAAYHGAVDTLIADLDNAAFDIKIGRASCRERV